MRSLTRIGVFAFGFALLVAGCDNADLRPSDGSSASESELTSPSFDKFSSPAAFPDTTGGTLEAGKLTVCKVATDDPTQSFTFTSTLVAGSGSGTFVTPVDLEDGTCEDVYTAVAGPSNPVETVNITETVPAGWQLDKVEIWSILENASSPTGFDVVREDDKYTASIDGYVDAGKVGCLLVYYNSKVPTGGEGCTPGYWKRTAQDYNDDGSGPWGPTGYEPGDSFQSVWSAFPDGSLTLLEALNLGGGGLNALARHAVAALLNASHPDIDYDLAVQQIVDGGNGAIQAYLDASNEEEQKAALEAIEALKDALDDFNNQGCSLDRHGNPKD